MARVITPALLLLVGGLFGWWSRGLQQAVVATDAPQRPSQVVAQGDRSASIGQPQWERPLQSASPPPEATDPRRLLRQFLEQQDFPRAVALYEQVMQVDEELGGQLRQDVHNYLQACLEQCATGVFVELAAAWLGSYYEDVPVLLMLAEYQRRQGYPEEAATVLQLAMTYAYQPAQRDPVNAALRQLVTATDDDLSQQQRWIELAGFYELLDSIALSQPHYVLRQAMLYRMLGEPERARSLLLGLQSSDDGLDTQWTQAVASQLAATRPEPEATVAPLYSVPVEQRGDHYLVKATVNGRKQVSLMIDTGASVTSISRESFDSLRLASFDYQGSRLFNTANGLAQAEVYRAASLSLGRTRMNGIDVAVLDFDAPPGTDGLLGMNVLRNFRFEIDQDRSLLLLRPR